MPESKAPDDIAYGKASAAPDTALERELLKELTRLRDEICAADRTPCEQLDARTNLGVFRLFSGITLQQWRSIARRLELKGWLTLPIDRDIYPHLTVLQESLDELSYQSDHDALTGLANRRAFDRVLDLEMERAARAENALSLAVIDLDDFKRINDTHGHVAGDEVLVRLARIISGNKRRYDLAARIGGEEFAIVLPGIGQVRSAKVVERIRCDLLESGFSAPGSGSFQVSCSAGIASYRGTARLSPREFFELADKALYAAKNSGKNRTELAPMPDIEQASRPSLVQASEKRFLFTGKP
ncbi:MAG: GGDEF domain-containing protein [Desulfovibrio sp.]